MRLLNVRNLSIRQLFCRSKKRKTDECAAEENKESSDKLSTYLEKQKASINNDSREGTEDQDITPSSSQEKQESLLEEMTQLSIATFPSDINTNDSALHIACHQHYTDDLITDILLKEDPNLVFWENAQKELPLHSAMRDIKEIGDTGQKGVSEKVLDKLLYLNEDAVRHLNFQDCLPIHIACQCGSVNEPAIKRLLKIYPESVMVQSKIALPFDETMKVEDSDEPSHAVEESTYFGLFQYLLHQFQNPIGICGNKEEDNSDPMETNFSPLHLAILNNASPNIVDHILALGNAYCLNLKTSTGRTAMDIAKTMPNSEDSIEVMQSYSINAKKSIELQAFSKSVMNLTEKESIDTKLLWRKAGKAVIFVNRLGLLLGPPIDEDENDSIELPDSFVPPASLEYSCLDVTLPVGFHRLRWALLSSQSTFYKKFHEFEMGYTQ